MKDSEFVEMCLFCANKHRLNELEFVCPICACYISKMHWINPKDKLPEHGQLVLICKKNICAVTMFFVGEKMFQELAMDGHNPSGSCRNRNGFASVEVPGHVVDADYWMPLPKVPND